MIESPAQGAYQFLKINLRPFLRRFKTLLEFKTHNE